VADNPRIEELRRRLERDPGSRLFAQLAEELRRAGELDEAVRVCRDGLEVHGGYASAKITLGRSLSELGDLDGAAAEFEGVLRTAPDNLSASRYLGECLEKRGDTAGALKRYQAALLHAPSDEWMRSRVSALAGSPGSEPSAGVAVGAAAAQEPEGAEDEAPTLPAAPAGDAAPLPIAPVEEDEGFVVETSEGAMQVGGPAPAAQEARGGGVAEGMGDDEEFELETPAVRPSGGPPALTFRPLVPEDVAAVEAAVPGLEPSPFVAPPAAAPPPPPAVAPAPVTPPPVAAPAVAPPRGAEPPGRAEAPVAVRREPGVKTPEGEMPPIRLAAEPGAEQELASATLAELYLKQGSAARAAAMYEELLARDPGNASLTEGLAAARAGLGGMGRRERVERVVGRLEDLLKSVQDARSRASG